MCRFLYFQKQPSRGVLSKRCSENMQQIYKRTPMPKRDFNKVSNQPGSLFCSIPVQISLHFLPILLENQSLIFLCFLCFLSILCFYFIFVRPQLFNTSFSVTPPASCSFCTNNAASKSIILPCIIFLYEKLTNQSIQSFKKYLFFVFCNVCFLLISNNTLHVTFYTYICY